MKQVYKEAGCKLQKCSNVWHLGKTEPHWWWHTSVIIEQQVWQWIPEYNSHEFLLILNTMIAAEVVALQACYFSSLLPDLDTQHKSAQHKYNIVIPIIL